MMCFERLRKKFILNFFCLLLLLLSYMLKHTNERNTHFLCIFFSLTSLIHFFVLFFTHAIQYAFFFSQSYGKQRRGISLACSLFYDWNRMNEWVSEWMEEKNSIKLSCSTIHLILARSTPLTVLYISFISPRYPQQQHFYNVCVYAQEKELTAIAINKKLKSYWVWGW